MTARKQTVKINAFFPIKKGLKQPPPPKKEMVSLPILLIYAVVGF